MTATLTDIPTPSIEGPSANSGSDSRESACNAGGLGSIPGLGRSPEGGNGYPPLENPMDGGAWQATLQGVANMTE